MQNFDLQVTTVKKLCYYYYPGWETGKAAG